jgi:hypothetical protein
VSSVELIPFERAADGSIDLLWGGRVDEFVLGDECEVTVGDLHPTAMVVVGLLFRRVRLSPIKVGVAARQALRRVTAVQVAVLVAAPAVRVMVGETFDVSRTGVGLHLPEALEVGTRAAVRFDLNGHVITGTICVKSVSTTKPPLNGCLFTHLATADREWIARYTASMKASS